MAESGLYPIDPPTPRRSPADLEAVAESIGSECELAMAGERARRRPENVLGLLVRPVTRAEIAIMEARGSRADDWSRVQVAEDFDPFRVRRTHIIGDCVLGRFRGDVAVMPGITLPTGIYDCTLIDSQVGNDCLLENVRFVARAVVEHEAVLFDVGSVTGSEGCTYGCDQEISLGCEVGGREVPLWPEIDVDAAALIAAGKEDRSGQDEVAAAVRDLRGRLTCDRCWVRRGAVIRHTERVSDSYIGGAVRVDQAREVDACVVYGAPGEETRIAAGAGVSRSIVQPGVQVAGAAIVRCSALLEHATVDEHAVVTGSLIGPNSQIAKGEVTASLVGPFVGLHHQSLLIAAFWPAGKGNVAYGAMVGSNHTGRAPDQEVWPGEGTFFGLGCSIRFPSDFSRAPYTVIGAGTSTLAQQVSFPFSLIGTPAEPLGAEEEGVPRAYNEIQPGWGLFANAYAIVRMESKFARRDRARRTALSYQVLSAPVMRLVDDAVARLRAVTAERTIYTEDDIPGLGKNFLREAVRRRAITAYEAALLRYALRILLNRMEGRDLPEEALALSREILEGSLPGRSDGERLRELIAVERRNAEIVQSSKEADDHRGRRIVPGYAAAHVAAEADPVVTSAWERVATTERRIAEVLG